MRLILFSILFICFSLNGSANTWNVIDWNDLSDWTIGYGIDTGCPSPGMCFSQHTLVNEVTNETASCTMITWHGGVCGGDWQMICGGSLKNTKIFYDFINPNGANVNCGIK